MHKPRRNAKMEEEDRKIILKNLERWVVRMGSGRKCFIIKCNSGLCY
jgi:hypothetical protein